MPRVALRIVGIAAALVVLVLIGVAIAIATVNPTRFVAPLLARVKAATGRDLSVQGPVHIAYSLQPKIVLRKVSFANAPWGKAPAMLTADRVDVEIALLPLLSRRFEIVEFVFIDPAIALETDANGRGNWEFRSAPASGASGSASPASPFAVGIGSFQVRNGKLTYRSGRSGEVTSASIDAMTLRARDMNSPVAVDFRGVVGKVPIAVSGDLGAPDRWLRSEWPYPIALQGEVAGKAAKVSGKLSREGKTTTLGDLNATYGGVAATGSLGIVGDDGHSKYVIELHIPSLSVAELAAAAAPDRKGAAMSAPAKAEAARGAFVIPDAALPAVPLLGSDAQASVGIDDLVLRDGAHLKRVNTKLTSGHEAVDATFDIGEVFGGSLRGRLRVDEAARTPHVRASVEAHDLDLPALAAKAGVHRDIHGGRVRLNLDVDGRGASPHAIASTMNGSILAVSGPATLGRTGSRGEDAFAQLLGALDPLQKVDAATELRCAVFRLPVQNGVAHVDRSIAVETGKLSASASGTVNFRDETLDLSVHPQLHEGVKIDVSQIASMVRIRGRFDKPTVGIDAASTAKTLAEIGALGASGAGIAAIGRALIAPSAPHEDVCATALGERAAKREAAPAHAPASPAPSQPGQKALPDELGKALGKLLGR